MCLRPPASPLYQVFPILRSVEKPITEVVSCWRGVSQWLRHKRTAKAPRPDILCEQYALWGEISAWVTGLLWSIPFAKFKNVNFCPASHKCSLLGSVTLGFPFHLWPWLWAICTYALNCRVHCNTRLVSPNWSQLVPTVACILLICLMKTEGEFHKPPKALLSSCDPGENLANLGVMILTRMYTGLACLQELMEAITVMMRTHICEKSVQRSNLECSTKWKGIRKVGVGNWIPTERKMHLALNFLQPMLKVKVQATQGIR